MSDYQNYLDILFFDIETASQVENYSMLSDETKKFWDLKSTYVNRDALPEDTYERAAIYAEFGKIVCISCGYITEKSELRITSFFGPDEKKILEDFREKLETKKSNDKNKNTLYFSKLCGHNSKEFDIPYVARRMLINGIKLPSLLNIAGKKPWEVNHLDTMDLWRFGDYKHFSSLALLTHIFGIPTPKDDINGSEVGRVFWQEKNYKRIAEYCAKDVKATTQLFLRLMGENTIPEESVIIIQRE